MRFAGGRVGDEVQLIEMFSPKKYLEYIYIDICSSVSVWATGYDVCDMGAHARVYVCVSRA